MEQVWAYTNPSRGFLKTSSVAPRLSGPAISRNSKACFQIALQDVSVDEFYRIINRVHASYIRVDADEVTYNFHVILRFELEMALIEETLSIDDLPEAWNAKMQTTSTPTQ